MHACTLNKVSLGVCVQGNGFVSGDYTSLYMDPNQHSPLIDNPDLLIRAEIIIGQLKLELVIVTVYTPWMHM